MKVEAAAVVMAPVGDRPSLASLQKLKDSSANQNVRKRKRNRTKKAAGGATKETEEAEGNAAYDEDTPSPCQSETEVNQKEENITDYDKLADAAISAMKEGENKEKVEQAEESGGVKEFPIERAFLLMEYFMLFYEILRSVAVPLPESLLSGTQSFIEVNGVIYLKVLQSPTEADSKWHKSLRYRMGKAKLGQPVKSTQKSKKQIDEIYDVELLKKTLPATAASPKGSKSGKK